MRDSYQPEITRKGKLPFSAFFANYAFRNLFFYCKPRYRFDESTCNASVPGWLSAGFADKIFAEFFQLGSAVSIRLTWCHFNSKRDIPLPGQFSLDRIKMEIKLHRTASIQAHQVFHFHFIDENIPQLPI